MACFQQAFEGIESMLDLEVKALTAIVVSKLPCKTDEEKAEAVQVEKQFRKVADLVQTMAGLFKATLQ
jgi:hypothetical protein